MLSLMSIPNDSFFFVVASNARKCGNHILVVSALNSMFCALKLTVKNRSAARKPSPQNPIYSTALKKNILSTVWRFQKSVHGKQGWVQPVTSACFANYCLINTHGKSRNGLIFYIYKRKKLGRTSRCRMHFL